VSYDFYIEMDAGGPEPLCLDPDFGQVELPDRVKAVVGDERIGTNYTSNVWRMWDEALGTANDSMSALYHLSGEVCGDIVEQLERAVDDMIARPDFYRQWNPANGWGDYEGALRYLAGIEAYCRAYPKARLRISA
jgi:hypothetical protein